MSGSSARIRAILWKEWHELRQLKALIWGAVGMPMLFTLIPLAVLALMSVLPGVELSEFDGMMEMLAADPGFGALGDVEKMQVIMGRPLSMFILLLPVMIPGMVAAYSIVGEKTSQTLEPLLATPVRTWELLVGKMLTAFIPTLVLTWSFAGIFMAGAAAVTSDAVFGMLISGPWIAAMLLLAPALSMLAIAVTVGISSRAKDPRSAQEVTALLVVPIVMIIPAQLGGLFILGTPMVIAAAGVMAVLAVVAIWIVNRLFDREFILTRWR